MKKISVMLCMLMGFIHAQLGASKGVIMDEFVEVGVGLNNQLKNPYPLIWVEDNVTREGVTITGRTQTSFYSSKNLTLGDPVVGNIISFVVRYTIPPEIKERVNAEAGEETGDYFKDVLQNQRKLYALLHKRLKESRPDGLDNILLSNGKEGEDLRSIRFCFGLPVQEGFPPESIEAANMYAQCTSGIEYEHVPQVRYTLFESLYSN